jgi:hypothetical protein
MPLAPQQHTTLASAIATRHIGLLPNGELAYPRNLWQVGGTKFSANGRASLSIGIIKLLSLLLRGTCWYCACAPASPGDRQQDTALRPPLPPLPPPPATEIPLPLHIPVNFV